MSTTISGSKLDTLKNIFWPVESFENKKVIPMALMMFFILFNYTILRDVKDAIIVTAPGSGAEALSFLKVYGTLPFAILMAAFYGKLSTLMKKQTLFYTTISFMLTFFALFAFIFFPNKEFFNMSYEGLLQLQTDYPRFKWVMPLFANWTFSLFYIFSEIWGTFALSVLFWTFANQTTKSSEAKRFYPLFGMIGNVGLMFSGGLLKQFTSMNPHLPEDIRWMINLKWIVSAVIIAGFLVMYIYSWINKHVLTDPRLYDPSEIKVKKKKEKLGFLESMKTVFKSKYIGYIAILVLGYGVAINLVEITWKGQIKLQYTNANDYTGFMGQFSMIVGAVTICLMVVGNNILRRFGWFTGAIITPIMLLVTGVAFFTFVIFRDSLGGMMAAFTMTPVVLSIWLGLAQNVASKSTKYSLFDPTKEMAYIPLDENLKVRGKAAVDGIGGRLGKSGGALIQQVLLISIVGSTQITIAPYISVIMAVVVFMWIIAVFGLNREYKKIINDKNQLKKIKKSKGC